MRRDLFEPPDNEEDNRFCSCEWWEIERDVLDAIELDRLEETTRRLKEEEDGD